jgi:hypothetical protein
MLAVDKRTVDDVIDAYVEWREECVGVWEAESRWSAAAPVDAELAFAAYRAALDREECASTNYARLLMRLGHARQSVATS